METPEGMNVSDHRLHTSQQCSAVWHKRALPASLPPLSPFLSQHRGHTSHTKSYLNSVLCTCDFFFQTSNCLKIIMLELRRFNRIPKMYIRYPAGLILHCYDRRKVHSELPLLCLFASRAPSNCPWRLCGWAGGTQLGNVPAHSLVLSPITGAHETWSKSDKLIVMNVLAQKG